MYYAYTAGVGVLSRFYFYQLYLTAQNLLILCGFFFIQKHKKQEKTLFHTETGLKIGTPTGNRTPVTAVKGRCPNR